MKKHFFIFFCFVFCGLFGESVMAADQRALCKAIDSYKSGQDIDRFLRQDAVTAITFSDSTEVEKVSPIEVAVSGTCGSCAGNYEAVKAMLAKRPDLAKANMYKNSEWAQDEPILKSAIGACCGGAGSNCGPNRAKEIVELLIENGADINFIIKNPNVNEGYQTLLDYVVDIQKTSVFCKKNGVRACKEIEDLLRTKGVQTYKELRGASSSNTATTVVASTSETPVATESLTTADTQVKDDEQKDEVVSAEVQTIVPVSETSRADDKVEDAVSNNAKETEKTVDKSNNEKQPQAQTVTQNNMEQKKAQTENVVPVPEAENINRTQAQNENQKALVEKQKAYDDAKAKEQSTENKLLGGLTTAATGIGGMELMQGLAEQSADKDAMADMTAYIETMRCTYGDGKQVKAGSEEIELPGANDQELMKLRTEYLALAADLKERKEALGMKPGIESEVILDRATTGLYDDENIGITGGNYGSLYRAQMQNNETDQAKLAEEQNTSAKLVKGGALGGGVGVVGGVVGNSLINGELGKMLKSKKSKSETEKLLEKEADALKDLQSCLKDAGVKDTDKLEFKNFYPSVLNVKNIKCKDIKLKDKTASELFADSNNETEIFNSMNKYFDMATISKMVGFTKPENETDIKNKIKSSMADKQKKMDEAKKKDVKSNSKDSNSSNTLGNIDLNKVKEKAGGMLGGAL